MRPSLATPFKFVSVCWHIHSSSFLIWVSTEDLSFLKYYSLLATSSQLECSVLFIAVSPGMGCKTDENSRIALKWICVCWGGNKVNSSTKITHSSQNNEDQLVVIENNFIKRGPPMSYKKDELIWLHESDVPSSKTPFWITQHSEEVTRHKREKYLPTQDIQRPRTGEYGVKNVRYLDRKLLWRRNWKKIAGLCLFLLRLTQSPAGN